MSDDQIFFSNLGQPELFHEAIRRFDEENSRDPNKEIASGVPQPRELVYARRLSDWVIKLNPSASEPLRLAARCQHICRWTIPRNSYDMNRAGYLRWRNDLKQFHAEKAGNILGETGYPEEIIHQVQALNLKKNYPKDPDSRVLEDALCLVFLEYQLAELATRTDEGTLIDALRKAWGKMTPHAHEEALKLSYEQPAKALLDRALKDI